MNKTTENEILMDGNYSEPKITATRQESTFAGDLLKLVSGTTIAQVIGALFMLVLTRLFAPEAFGVYTLFASIVSIISIISCFSYELSIVLPKDDDQGSNQLAISVLISLLFSLSLFPLIWLAGPWFLQLIHAPELGPYLWLIPPTIFLGGIGAGHPGLNYWSFRTKQVMRQSITLILGVLVASLAQFFLGMTVYATGGGLIVGALIGSAVSTIWLGIKTWNSDKKLFINSIRPGKMIEGIKRYRKFPLFTNWSTLLNTVSWQLPAFLLASFFSTEVVGFYSLGDRVIKMPMNLIGSALSRVFYPRAAQAINDNTLSTLTEGLFNRLVAFLFFPLLTFTLIGREVFILLFGSAWAEAGEYSQILSLFTFVWFISAPLSGLYNVLEKQELILKFNVINLITRVAALLIGGYFQSPKLALMLYAASGIFVYGYLSLAIMAVAHIPWQRSMRTVVVHFLQFVPLGIILLFLKYLDASPFLIVLVAGLALAIYMLNVIYKDKDLKNYLLFSERLRAFDKKLTQLLLELRSTRSG